MAVERKKVDWEIAEREYRAGKLSLREIGALCGCSETAIRKKAKALGWLRDLSAKIDNQVRNKMVRNNVRSANPSEKEIVETASDRIVEVVRSHQDILGRGMSLVKKLMAQAEKSIDDDDITLQAKASALVSLSVATKNFIDKERQSHGIPDGENDPGKKSVSDMTMDELAAVVRGDA